MSPPLQSYLLSLTAVVRREMEGSEWGSEHPCGDCPWAAWNSALGCPVVFPLLYRQWETEDWLPSGPAAGGKESSGKWGTLGGSPGAQWGTPYIWTSLKPGCCSEPRPDTMGALRASLQLLGPSEQRAASAGPCREEVAEDSPCTELLQLLWFCRFASACQTQCCLKINVVPCFNAPLSTPKWIL